MSLSTIGLVALIIVSGLGIATIGYALGKSLR